MARKRLLLVGWDSADWKIIHPLLEAGLLPGLEQLVNRGVSGNLTTLLGSGRPPSRAIRQSPIWF